MNTCIEKKMRERERKKRENSRPHKKTKQPWGAGLRLGV
jgi:hypothetical protein